MSFPGISAKARVQGHPPPSSICLFSALVQRLLWCWWWPGSSGGKTRAGPCWAAWRQGISQWLCWPCPPDPNPPHLRPVYCLQSTQIPWEIFCLSNVQMYWHENVHCPHSRCICDCIVSFIPNEEIKLHTCHVPFLLGKILLYPSLILGKSELCGPVFLEGQQVSSRVWACRDTGGVARVRFHPSVHPQKVRNIQCLSHLSAWRNQGLGE